MHLGGFFQKNMFKESVTPVIACEQHKVDIYYIYTYLHFYDVDLSLGSAWINPLTPELNPSKQPCPPGFFTGDFKF